MTYSVDIQAITKVLPTRILWYQNQIKFLRKPNFTFHFFKFFLCVFSLSVILIFLYLVCFYRIFILSLSLSVFILYNNMCF